MSNEIYALHLDGKLITDRKALWKQYSKNYGMNSLQGWRPGKTVYFSLGRAKAGIRHLPKEVQNKIEIIKYEPTKCSI